MNHLKKIIIGILVCTFGIILLIIPDNQIPKKINNQINKKEISNDFDEPKSTNKVSKKKIVFIIIGIVVIIILIISLIIFFIKKRNNKLLEDFLSKSCYFSFSYLNIQIYFGHDSQSLIGYVGNDLLFLKDIDSPVKKQFNFYKTLADNQNLKNSLITFYKLAIGFLFQIDGHLLKACYDPNNNNTPLGQMSKNFNEKTLIDQERIKILEFDKTDATRDLSDEEKQLLLNNDYVNLFKTIMQNKNLPYYVEQNIIQKQQLLNNHGSILNEKLPIFEHCHAIYMKIKDIYSELTTFFSKPENEEHSNKYKAKIDNAMKAINNFLEIQQENNQPPT